MRAVVAVLLFVACALGGANAMSRDAAMERDLVAEELADAAEAEGAIDTAQAEAEAVAVEAESESEAAVDAEAEAAVGAANCMSTAGLAMIKSFEGFYPKQYKDVAGIPTIGYGTLCKDNLIKCPGPVTEPVAARVLANDLLKKYGPCVSASVKCPLNNNQYSALVSFAYNAGCGALATVAKNNKLDKTSGYNLAAVPANMLKYNKARVNGVLQVVRGLTNRRNAEVTLFRSSAAASCMPTVLRSGAPVLRNTAPITQYAECKALGGTCQTAACGGSIVRNKCGPGAPTCCVPKPATPVAPTPVTPTPVTPAPAAGANCMSVAGLAMVKSFEGFYANAYNDVAGIPTIGYGTLCRDNIIRCPGPVSEATAAAVLGAELVKKYSGCVRSAVKAPLNNNQFSALTSFAYNAGCGAASNVIRYAKLDQPNAAAANYKVVPQRMALYNKARVKGVLQVVRGLVRRRAAEGALFVSTASAQCMAGAVLRSTAPTGAAAGTAIAPAKKRRALNTAHSVFNLRAGEVDLPSGTQVTYGDVPNSTQRKIVAMADIAPDVHSHEHDHPRKNRGPVGRWSKRAQREAKDEPVQNLVISVQI